MENGLSCGQHASSWKPFLRWTFAGSQAQADVALFNDDHGIRITVTDFFSTMKGYGHGAGCAQFRTGGKSLFQCLRRAGASDAAKEIPTGDTFSAQVVLETLELMRQAAVRLYETAVYCVFGAFLTKRHKRAVFPVNLC